MNTQQITEKLYAKETIEIERQEYIDRGRDAMLDYWMRSRDLGRTDLVAHCREEVARLDKLFDYKPVNDVNL